MKLLMQAAWPLSIAFAVLWALRLWRTHLSTRYPWLFFYLLFVSSQGAIGIFLYYSGLSVGGRPAYSVFWPIVQPILWLCTFGVVFEIFGRLLEGYRGLQTLGRLVVYGTLGLVGLAVIVALMVDAFTIADLNRWKVFWLKQEQSMSLVIAGSLFLLFLFQKAFPSLASPNVRLLFVGFALYHAIDASLSVIRNYLGPGFRDFRDLAGTVCYAAFLALGWLRFSRAGESSPLSESVTGRRRDELTGAAGSAARHIGSFNDRLEVILRQKRARGNAG
jgi:hypothetical protein